MGNIQSWGETLRLLVELTGAVALCLLALRSNWQLPSCPQATLKPQRIYSKTASSPRRIYIVRY
ncbi:hypothetical protein [Rhodoferax sp.]|uniref:hypothetical protein n=1 Tax=Rhodoferax sp. TaxID=50421 RepID=UPI0017BD8DBF|nr:hypothetical protein [Rhodoferax sp.]MBA3058952.1 hypothetical protein [Rhodoferax sp.]MBU3997447.1 hypothetical protein [Gammaproteobacteria bacterium]MBU4111876.1 hypothetical protein [Gammaproteobacteria bacterium]MBU4170690.1 hypothetical protein [Gammaproteobacteria bacterium]